MSRRILKQLCHDQVTLNIQSGIKCSNEKHFIYSQMGFGPKSPVGWDSHVCVDTYIWLNRYLNFHYFNVITITSELYLPVLLWADPHLEELLPTTRGNIDHWLMAATEFDPYKNGRV